MSSCSGLHSMFPASLHYTIGLSIKITIIIPNQSGEVTKCYIKNCIYLLVQGTNALTLFAFYGCEKAWSRKVLGRKFYFGFCVLTLGNSAQKLSGGAQRRELQWKPCLVPPSSLNLHFFVCLFVSRRVCLCSSDYHGTRLSRAGWPQTHRHPPASAHQVLRLEA